MKNRNFGSQFKSISRTLPNIQNGAWYKNSEKTFSVWLFLQKAPSFMFGQILSLPLKPGITCVKSFISDVWKGFELAFVAINYFHKSIVYLFTKIGQHIPLYIKQYSIAVKSTWPYVQHICWITKIKIRVF